MDEKSMVGYVWENLYGTILILAQSKLDLRTRFEDAVTSRLFRTFLPDPENKKLPKDLPERLKLLERKLTIKGTYSTSIQAMDDSEIEETIEEIITAYNIAVRFEH
jgi:hypothetical protein